MAPPGLPPEALRTPPWHTGAMNLPLHLGWLGILEAAAIAFAVGLVAYLGWHALCRGLRWSEARAVGWACVTAVAAGAGIDAWKLFYLGMMKLESPLYARLALADIHDPERLGVRVVCETLAALSGVVLAWLLFSGRSAARNAASAAVLNENPSE